MLHHGVGRLRRVKHPEQVEFDHLLVEPRGGLGGRDMRRTTGVVDQHVQPTVPLVNVVDQAGDGVRIANVAPMELVADALDGPAGAGHHGRALGGEHVADPGPDPRTPPVTSTTRPFSPRLMPSREPESDDSVGWPGTVLAYQASACLGSRSAMPITSSTIEPGIVAVTVDYPPVNAIPSRGWFDLADAVTAAGRDPRPGW